MNVDNVEKIKDRQTIIKDTVSQFVTSSYSASLCSKTLEELRPAALSVDVTNKCNLRCKHCFWDSHKSFLPMGTNKNIINHVKTALKKYPTITNITWYGGEPLIDEEAIGLVEQGLRLKKNNLVITNGYFPLPNWWQRDVHFAVSIDGTEKINDEIRGLPGLYRKVKENISEAVRKKVPVAVIYCLNAVNINCVPTFLEEWVDIGLIGMVFTTYMPFEEKDPSLILSDEQRDKIADLLIKMKKKYGSFIGNTECMIELIRAKYGKELVENCLMNVLNKKAKVYSLHMSNDGNIRIPCAFGAGASYLNCLHCRSVTKIALYAGKVLRDRASLLGLFRMYHSKPYSKEKKLSISLIG